MARNLSASHPECPENFAPIGRRLQGPTSDRRAGLSSFRTRGIGKFTGRHQTLINSQTRKITKPRKAAQVPVAMTAWL